jgi:hypothetical protein
MGRTERSPEEFSIEIAIDPPCFCYRSDSPTDTSSEALFGSPGHRTHKDFSMSTSDGHLIRKAFLTKYGYAPDLTYEEIVCEFRRRYDQAQVLRQENVETHRVMLIIEGISQNAAKEEASRERALRKVQIKLLTEETGFGPIELDQLVEGFAERLEVEWIQRM